MLGEWYLPPGECQVIWTITEGTVSISHHAIHPLPTRIPQTPFPQADKSNNPRPTTVPRSGGLSLDLATLSRAGIRLPNSPSWRRSLPSTKDTRAAALAVATSIVARFPWRSAPTSSGHGWPRQCLTSAAVIIWADGL